MGTNKYFPPIPLIYAGQYICADRRNLRELIAQLVIPIFLIAGMTSEINAQKLTMDRIDLAKDKLIVFYSLDDVNPNHQYQVDLYSSKDNFAVPLTKVKGDVGAEVKAGKDKKIEWSVVQEIGNYAGDLSLEVRARVYVPFVKVTGLREGAVYKRGRSYPLLWTSGNMGGQVDIELYKDQTRVDGDRNVPNTGKYEYAVPGSAKPGKDYRLKFTNTRNRDEFVYSPQFQIKPRVPFLVKAAGVAAVGGAIIFLSGQDGGGNGGDTESRLPGLPGSKNGLPD